MPIKINGATYYRTAEVARKAGISRSTLLRWVDDASLRTHPVEIGVVGGCSQRTLSRESKAKPARLRPTMKRGILEIRLPKVPAAKSTNIAIKAK